MQNYGFIVWQLSSPVKEFYGEVGIIWKAEKSVYPFFIPMVIKMYSNTIFVAYCWFSSLITMICRPLKIEKANNFQ